jgi:hypothetical protein
VALANGVKYCAVVLAKDELRRLSQRAKGPDADILLFQIALLEDESFTNENKELNVHKVIIALPLK